MNLTELSKPEIDELINRLQGHGGYSPIGYSQCKLCKLKDYLRELIQEMI